MSSINDDITKEIEDLLRQKEYQRPPSTKRPPSKHYDHKYDEVPSSSLFNAGKRALSREGVDYDGLSLGTISNCALIVEESTAGNGSVDINRIHSNNERRLNELRKLGVESVNTNNDE
jgi:hypothetical protein